MKLNNDNNLNVTIIGSFKNEGKGAAFRCGYKHTSGDYIVLMDSDLQIRPAEIKTFKNVMDLYNADAVIGNE